MWATEFSNVHTTFGYHEKPIKIDGEMYPGMRGFERRLNFFQDQNSISNFKNQLELKTKKKQKIWCVMQAQIKLME